MAFMRVDSLHEFIGLPICKTLRAPLPLMLVVLLAGWRTERTSILDRKDQGQPRHSSDDKDPSAKGWEESDFVNLGFHLYSHPPEVAAFGFNPSGYVNATVGERGGAHVSRHVLETRRRPSARHR